MLTPNKFLKNQCTYKAKKKYHNYPHSVSPSSFLYKLISSWNRHFLWIVPLSLSMLLIYHNPKLLASIPSQLIEDIQPNQVKKIQHIQQIFNEIEASLSSDTSLHTTTKLQYWIDKESSVWLYYYKTNKNSIELTPVRYRNPLFQLHEIQLTSAKGKHLETQLLPVYYMISELTKPKNLNLSELHSSFPKETRLLHYQIKEKKLILNFNDAFLKTSHGKLGKQVQLMQLLATFFRWPFINSIQIKVNGISPMYLDRHGIIQNKTFYRNDIIKSFVMDVA